MKTCTLCDSNKIISFFQDKKREYFRCEDCGLIFVPEKYHLSPQEEKAHYDLHENSPADQNYRKFLNRLFIPLNKKLPKKSKGLDFGSGPGPTLSIMFQEADHDMEIYDLYYSPAKKVLNDNYDFITATEVVEHLRSPRKTLEEIWEMIQPGGYLGIMTKLALDIEAFSKWHYKDDPTHICFYSEKTFEYIASKWKAEISTLEKDVIILKKANFKAK